ncbi:LacI family DNA-binding transcriptional regulator [Ahrensia kielensis]|uniref:LacI family DNA-binding transcriptional regulator n=1 Tax=Ahrensia kielensis TaxID=76980 RepID=A0ABU9TA64_9HYPH
MTKSSTKVTALDVAKRAGVSQPTVSRVFSRGSMVRKSVREKVEAAARDLGYMPNTLARSLITGKSRTIGVVVAYLNNPFYPEALEKLSASLNAKNYHISIFFAANLDDEVDPVIEKLLAQQVDGMILASVSISNKLSQRLNEVGIPFVLFNRGQLGDNIASVTAANYSGGRKAAEFLVAAGHSRIAHISGWQKSLNGQQRQAGFTDYLNQQGMEAFACIDGEFSREKAAQVTRDLFAGDKKPDAIFVGNDHMAFAVLETLKTELRLNVPNDVSLIGYDDVQMASWKTFDLTTLRQPANRMVEATTSMLLNMIEDPATLRQKIEIESELIVRGSARIPDNWPKSEK